MKKCVGAAVLGVMLIANKGTVQSEPLYADTYLSADQVALIEQYAQEYNIAAPVLEAIVETESAGDNTAVNGSCYGICQINGDVWGYDYITEDEQIHKACEILISHLENVPDMAYALDCYGGYDDAAELYANAQMSEYSQKVLERANEITLAQEVENGASNINNLDSVKGNEK